MASNPIPLKYNRKKKKPRMTEYGPQPVMRKAGPEGFIIAGFLTPRPVPLLLNCFYKRSEQAIPNKVIIHCRLY